MENEFNQEGLKKIEDAIASLEDIITRLKPATGELKDSVAPLGMPKVTNNAEKLENAVNDVMIPSIKDGINTLENLLTVTRETLRRVGVE